MGVGRQSKKRHSVTHGKQGQSEAELKAVALEMDVTREHFTGTTSTLVPTTL